MKATTRPTQTIRTIRPTQLLQVGDVIWRERKEWAHGKRPFIVFKVLNDTEALAVPLSTTVDFLGRMPAIKAGTKAAWISPQGVARIKRDRYQAAKRVDGRDLAQVFKAFRIWNTIDPLGCKRTLKQAQTAGRKTRPEKG